MVRRIQQPGGQYDFSKKEEVIIRKAISVVLVAMLSLSLSLLGVLYVLVSKIFLLAVLESLSF